MSSHQLLLTNSVLAVTGHRPQKLGHGDTLLALRRGISERIRHELVRLAPRHIITGMALGVDQWAALVALELGIPFIAAVPFVGQDSKWKRYERDAYHKLLRQAQRVFIVSPGDYSHEKMSRRNRFMVNGCDVLLAVWNGRAEGGTYNCVTYARKVKRPIIRVDPDDILRAA